jgi:flagellar hook-associated protein 2
MTPIALSGLASGLDTESIITQLISVERQPRTRMALADTQAQSRQATLRDISTKIQAVRDAATALYSATSWTDTQKLTSSDTARVAVSAEGTAAPGTRRIEVAKLAVPAQRAFAYSPNTSQQTTITFGPPPTPPGQTSTSQVPPFTLDVPPGSSAAAVAASLNANADAPVSAVVVNGDLVFTSRKTGLAGDFVADSPTLLEKPAFARAGGQAEYTVDGGATQKSDSNVLTDVILGASVTLKATTSGPVTVDVNPPGIDPEALKTKVKAFVTAYNSTVDSIRTKLQEKPVKGATTGTDAVKGLFYGDTLLSGMLSSMRSEIGGLADLGISTGNPSGTGKPSDDAVAGRLTLDDAKLTAALTADPAALRTRLETLGQRMSTVVAPLAGARVDARLTSVDSIRKRLATDMAAIDVRLADKEKSLRAKFSAMETALAASQAAQARLQAQLGTA